MEGIFKPKAAFIGALMHLLDLVRVDVQKRQKMKQILFSLLAYFILARGRVLLDTMDEGLMNYEEDNSFAQLQVGIFFVQ